MQPDSFVFDDVRHYYRMTEMKIDQRDPEHVKSSKDRKHAKGDILVTFPLHYT